MLAKHSKSFLLVDCISVGVDRMQRNFEPMRKQVEPRQRSELTEVTAKVVIYEDYEAFVEGTGWRHEWFVKLLSPCRIIPLVTILERRSLCLMWCTSRT